MKQNTFYLWGIGLLLLLAMGCATSKPERGTRQQIEAIMQEQSQAWNRGDLESFMAPYWRSDSLVFVGKSGPTFGWDKTLQNYKRSYPNQEAMGQLTFTLLHTDQLSNEVLLVVGKWHLRRRIGNVEGHFTLVFKKIGADWKIIADHSS